MFCVFLQIDDEKDESTIEIFHNGDSFKCSKDLCMKNSEKLASMINQETPINIDYDREDDDFQLISDLLNYKRIFITRNNIDFLEFAGEELQIPKLIRKTKKFKNQYEDIIENPIFKELKSLHNQVFSLLKVNTESTNDFNFDISNIQYEPEYSSTISHIIFGLCLAKPQHIPQYMKVVSSNPTLKKHFEDFLKNDILSNMLCNILRKHLILSLKPVENEVLMVKFQNSMLPTSDYDTGLLNYLEEVTNYLAKMNQNFSYFEKYVKAIKTDDVDNLQQLINMYNNVTSNPNSFKILMDCSAAYSSVKCVKYFMLNFQSQFGRQLEIEYNNVRASIIGGNLEIFHLLLEKYKGDRSSFIKDTIIFHQNKILKWIIENYVQFLSIYNTCCTRVLYDKNYIPQRYYHCKKCNYEDECCCHYCAKHCHVNHHNGKEHDVTYVTFCRLVYCDDECKLSQDMKPEGNKKFVEIDDLVLLSTYCANYDSLKILIKNGAYIPKCRDNPTRNQYSKMDQQLIKLFKEMRGFNDDKFMPKMTLNLKTQVKNDNECFVGEDGIGINMDGSKDHNYVSFIDQ